MHDGIDIGPGRLAVGMAALLVGLVCGCAAGEVPPANSCQTTEDCETGETCVDGTCVRSDATGGETDGSSSGATYGGVGITSGNSSGTDGGPDVVSDGGNGTPDAADTGGPEPDTTGTDADAGPTGCNGRCGLGETCDQGTCVSACDPECNSDQQCADIGNGPECFSTCQENFSPNGCIRSGELCRDVDPNNNREALVCVPSECSSDSDCTNGTCLNFANDYGTCVDDGPKSVGESCDLAAANQRCEKGAFCISEDPNASTGTCRTLCDPWAGSSSCNSSTRCSLFTVNNGRFSALSFRQGWCNPNVTDGGDEAPFAECNTAQAMCNHAIRCLPGNPNGCFKWCRPGEGDCVGTIPDGVSANGRCNNFVFAGIRRIGRCLPECDGNDFCSADGTACVNGICRRECSQSTVAADCCNNSGGQCPWSCNNSGLCE